MADNSIFTSIANSTLLFREWTKGRELTRKRFNNIKSLINGIYYYAIEEGIVAHNPVKDINSRQFTFKPVNNDDDVFTLEDRKKLLDYLKDDTSIYSLAIQLDFQLVIRIGELLALRWSDIENGNLHIQAQLLTERKMNDDLTFSKREHINVDHVKGNTDQGYRYQPQNQIFRCFNPVRQWCTAYSSATAFRTYNNCHDLTLSTACNSYQRYRQSNEYGSLLRVHTFSTKKKNKRNAVKSTFLSLLLTAGGRT